MPQHLIIKIDTDHGVGANLLRPLLQFLQCDFACTLQFLFVRAGTTADDIAAALGSLPNRVLPVMIVSTDRKPESWSHLAPLSVRECDGADAIGLCETLATVRKELEPGHSGTALAILTPPYAGHARDVRGRAPTRRDVADPIALCRQRLLAAGRLDEAGVTAIEAAVRDEIAAAGRATSLACTR